MKAQYKAVEFFIKKSNVSCCVTSKNVIDTDDDILNFKTLMRKKIPENGVLALLTLGGVISFPFTLT